MNSFFIRSNSNESASTMDTSIITLIPCDYDSSEEESEKSLNVSQDSIDSSDISESSDDKFEIINKIEFIKSEKNIDITKEDEIEKNKINNSKILKNNVKSSLI